MSPKQIISKQLRKRNLEIRKYPGIPFKTLPVFDLAVSFYMAKHGDRIDFVQIGANDGQKGDPLRKFIINHDWHGVLVEPQTDVFEQLRGGYEEFHDRLKFENVAISSRSGSLTLYRPKQSASSSVSTRSDVSSVNPRNTARQLNLSPSDLEQFEVPCMTLDDLLEKHRLQDLHVLSIDTEGHDWSVLSSLDMTKVKPAIIQFEHGHLSRPECREIAAHLDRFSYLTFWGGHQHDSVAIREDLLEL